MWALGFARKGKIVCEMQISSVAVIFLIGKFSAKFDLKSMISSLTK
jgi:hypothetical protein